MSYLESNSAFQQRELVHQVSASRTIKPSSKSSSPADRAIDAALRGVPLPDGLLMRLDQIAYTMPDEAADQVDCLGC